MQVLGAYLAFTDTPMNAGMSLPEPNDPADVVSAVLAGLEAGEHEVLADETTRRVRARLAGTPAQLHGVG